MPTPEPFSEHPDPIAMLTGLAAQPETGVRFGPAQTWGQLRMVPLLRDDPIVDLRLSPLLYDTDVALVQSAPRAGYISYVPHGYVADWTGDGTPAAAYGTNLIDRRDRAGGRTGDGSRERDLEKYPRIPCMSLRFQRRMARRVDKHRLRFLPLHLAMEGYLGLHFGGPTVAWEEWSHRALGKGLSPRSEASYVGADVPGLAGAQKIFELHPRQCGIMLWTGEELAAVMLTPHPEDYRALHATLVNDLFGETVYQYGALSTGVGEFPVRLADRRITSLSDMRSEAERVTAEAARFHQGVAGFELSDGEEYRYEQVYAMGSYRLSRFMPSFRRTMPSHIGEIITDDAGKIAYLKTFRLSVGQVKRGYLLSLLAEHDWNLAAAGAAIGISDAELGVRLDAAGFGYLLRTDILDRFRKLASPGVRRR